ncbi:MAG: tRNA (N(6)-L-threonylcarbamoyladenosine(37)-C(2))-methylthiotransferase MtaB [Epulopiscium sp. Nele67-Bin005]|nr:MAG: tRNA (N(6)-L-threonylcarbamoyladenosine(37)-C(2))-methylthiotransferase MtaB [Epulopiscium sp. Nele67-Bin005]
MFEACQKNVDLTLDTKKFFEQYNRNRRIATFTLGCKVNQYDTEAVVEQFTNVGYEVVNFNENADVYIVNTCTVTHLSDRKCRQMLRKTKRMNENSILVAMGCYVQSVQQKIKEEVPEVDIIIGTNGRSETLNMVNNYCINKTFDPIEDIMNIELFEELKISQIDGHTRAYLKIQEGCNNYCTYCIIPYVRGNIRSRQEQNVIEEAIRLTNIGFKEIILTGIHVASYGKDLNQTSLETLLPKLNDIENLERVRLSSIEPVVITEQFLNTINQLPKMCKHFHLSLQSGCDTVLERMNRKYTTDEYFASVQALKNVWEDVALTTDIIVGFPNETEEEFEETMKFVEKVGFYQIHIFPFSPREGTKASTMSGQVEPQIKEERAKRLKQLSQKLTEQFLQKQIDKTVTILVEKHENNRIIGHTSNYIKVKATLNTYVSYENQLVNVKIITQENGFLNGMVVN